MKTRIFQYKEESGTTESFDHFAAKNKNKKESEGQKKEEKPIPIEAALEDNKVINDGSEQVRVFDLKIRAIAKRLVPGRDFSDCHFLLQDSNDINAFATNPEPVSYIVVSKQLIDFVRNEDELAFILGHELTHYLLKKELGTGSNSRIEEGLADLKPLELMHETGYDVRQAYEFMQRLSPEVGRHLFGLDKHGSFPDRVLAVKNFIAALDNKVGGLKYSPTDAHLNEVVKDMKFESFFVRSKKENRYDEMSTSSQIEFLIKFVDDLEIGYWDRIKEYKDFLSNLQVEVKDLEKFSELAEVVTGRFEKEKDPAPEDFSSANEYLSKMAELSRIKDLRKAVIGAYDRVLDKKLRSGEGSVVELARALGSVPEWYEKAGGFKPIHDLVARQVINDEEDLRMFNMVVNTYAKSFESKVYGSIASRYIDFLKMEMSKNKRLDDRYLFVQKHLKELPEWTNLDKGIPGIVQVFELLIDLSKDSRSRYEKWMTTLQGGIFWNDAQLALKNRFPEIEEVSEQKKVLRKLKPAGSLEKGEQVEKLKKFLGSLPRKVAGLAVEIKESSGSGEEIRNAQVQSREKGQQIIAEISRGIMSLVKTSPEDAKQFLPDFFKKVGAEVASITRSEMAIGEQYLQMIVRLPDEILPMADKLKALRGAGFVELQLEFDLMDIKEKGMRSYQSWEFDDFDDVDFNEYTDRQKDNLPREEDFQLGLESSIEGLFKIRSYTMDQALGLYEKIKQEDPIFANDFLRLQVLGKLKDVEAPVNLLQLVKILDENPTEIKPGLVEADVFVGRALGPRIVNAENWPDNLFELVALYEVLNRKNFFPVGAGTQEVMGRRIISLLQVPQYVTESKIHFLKSLFRGPRMNDPQVRRLATDLFTSFIETKYGKDDGSEEYLKNIEEVCLFIEEINIIDRYTLAQEICDRITSQEGTSFRFRDAVIGKGVSRDALVQNSMDIMRKEFYYDIFSVFGDKKRTINFLINPLTSRATTLIAKSVADAAEEGSDIAGAFMKEFGNTGYRFIKKETKQLAALFHQNFWASAFPVRVAMLDKLIHEAHNGSSIVPSWYMGYELIKKKLIPQDDPHKNSIDLFLGSYLEVIPDYQKSLFLCALITAQQKSQESKKFEPGKILANILELLGPAEIKAGQVAHSFPETPEDIAEGLGRLKSKADVPARWDIFSMRNKLVPKEIISRIARTEQVNAASINITAHVVEHDGSERILVFERENAKERIDEGFSRLANMADKLGGSTMKTIKDILEEAKHLTEIEINEESNLKQSEIAFNNYNGVSIQGDKVSFNVKTPAVYSYGDRYEYMDYMKGVHFNDLPEKNNEQWLLKKKIAKACLSLEFAMTLAGKQTDRDRHGDNVRINVNGQQVEIGLFDFGGLDLEVPTEEQKKVLFEIFANVFSGLSSEGVITTIRNSIDEMITRNPRHRSFLRRQEQRFLALGDYLKILDFEDLQDAFYGALKAEGLDPVFEKMFAEKFGATKDAFGLLPSSIALTRSESLGNWVPPQKILVPVEKKPIRVIPEGIVSKKKE
jgi:hypothetical protein